MHTYTNDTAYGFIHVHSDHSLMDGAATVHDICTRAKEMGAKGLTLTDHGNGAGWADFLTECKKLGLRAGPGTEEYYCFNPGEYLPEKPFVPIQHAHLLLIAKNYAGYQDISHLLTAGQENCKNIGNITQPIVTKELLKQYLKSGNVFITSACVSGPLSAIYFCNAPIEKRIAAKDKLIQRATTFDVEKYRTLKKREAEILSSISELKEEAATLRKQKFPVATQKKGLETLYQTYIKAKKCTDSYHEEDYLSAEIYQDAVKGAKEAEQEALSVYQEAERNYQQIVKQANIVHTRLQEIESELEKLKKEKNRSSKFLKEYKNNWDKIIQHTEDKKNLLQQIRSEEERICMLRGELSWFRDTFGDNFFIELQYHGYEKEAIIMPILARLAEEFHIPILATNDSHIVRKEDALARHALMSLRMEKWAQPDPNEAEMYMKSDAELFEALSNILPYETVQKAMEGTRYIIDTCNVVLPEATHYPRYRDDSGRELTDKEAADMLRRITEEKVQIKFPNNSFTDIYRKRLEYEMETVLSMGFAHYFLIVIDYVNYARKLGPYEVGPGRGSGSGSLILYLNDITTLDPIQHNLIFERFLNPQRVSMPDIDVDFSELSRGQTIEYVRKKYGAELVARIRTIQKFMAKESIRSAARIIGYREYPKKTGMSKEDKVYIEKGRKQIYKLGDSLTKAIPDTAKNLSSCKKELLSVTDDPLAQDIIQIAFSLEGKAKAFSMHAGGVVISDGHPIADYVPLMLTGAKKGGKNNVEDDSMYAGEAETKDMGGQLCTSCDMIQLEGVFKLLKFDFLGLNYLNVISETITRVYNNYGIKLDLNNLPFEHDIFQKIYAAGNTDNVFQVESSGMRSMLMEFKPQSFDDIVLLIAAYRPGPMDFIPNIIRVKKGEETPHYIIPEQEKILSITYGYPIYQEQLMDIFHICAGFSLGEADNIRRAMSKKKEKEFLKYHPQFIEGIVKKGATQEEAETLWNSLLGFARYGFNKAHAAVYGQVSYISAYLKYHYPVEYMTSVLNWPPTKDKTAQDLVHCRKMNLSVIPPDINTSSYTFEDKNGKILYGLGMIKETDENSIRDILEHRQDAPYTGLTDCIARCKINKRTMESLINGGAFDKTDTVTRKAYLNALPELMEIKKKAGKEEKKSDKKEYTDCINQIQNYTILDTPMALPERLEAEYAVLGSYISAHPMDDFAQLYTQNVQHISDICKGEGIYAGVLTEINVRTSSQGNVYATFVLEDKTGIVKGIMFNKAFHKYGHQLQKGSIVRIFGTVRIEHSTSEQDNAETNQDAFQLIADTVETCRKEKPNMFFFVPNKTFFDRYVIPFIHKYEDEEGHPVVIYENETGNVITTPYYIKKEVMWMRIPCTESKLSRK